MSKKKLKSTMTTALKTAIKESKLTRYRIAKDTGIDEAALMRFMRGETSLRLDKADVLAEYLGLRLAPNPDAKPRQPPTKHKAQKKGK